MSKSEYESYLETIPYDAFGDYSVFRDQVSMEEENQQKRQEKTQK